MFPISYFGVIQNDKLLLTQLVQNFVQFGCKQNCHFHSHFYDSCSWTLILFFLQWFISCGQGKEPHSGRRHGTFQH